MNNISGSVKIGIVFRAEITRGLALIDALVLKEAILDAAFRFRLLNRLLQAVPDKTAPKRRLFSLNI